MKYVKYYDENGYLVGVSGGEITDHQVETEKDICNHILNLLATKPQRNGYYTQIIEDNHGQNSDIYDYNYVYVKIPDDELSDAQLIEKFKEEILNSITIGAKPAEKQGYHLVPHLNGTSIIWEFEANEAATPDDGNGDHEGSYLDPIPYVNGMTVGATLWYTDGSDIWEAIATGIPTDFTDRDYFDIVG